MAWIYCRIKYSISTTHNELYCVIWLALLCPATACSVRRIQPSRCAAADPTMWETGVSTADPDTSASPTNQVRTFCKVWHCHWPVLRIHDILVWIRIPIRGSEPPTNGSGFGSGCGSGSFYFHHWPSRCQQKTNFIQKVFLHVTFWRHFYNILQR